MTKVSLRGELSSRREHINSSSRSHLDKPLMPQLCWICGVNAADSGEHMTKRSDLLAVLGTPTQAQPFYYHSLGRANQLLRSLDAKILHSPIRICATCNNTRTQPHDRAWERMSDALRAYDLKVGQWLRPARVFPYKVRSHMLCVHHYFLKLFGCMLEEAKANGHDLGIDTGTFATAIMTGKPHPGVLLRFGKCDGMIGRSNLFAWTSGCKSPFASWLYQLDSIAVGVTYAPPDVWKTSVPYWHPNSSRYSKRLQIADFQYTKLAAEEAALQTVRGRIINCVRARAWA